MAPCNQVNLGRKARVPGKFIVKKGSTGKFRFALLATNGQVVATSEAYETKRAAMSGIASVKKLAADAAVVDTSAPAAEPAAAKKPAARRAAARKPAAKKAAAKK
jgi:uncharacterized protein YegP (UPF0339 family)